MSTILPIILLSSFKRRPADFMWLLRRARVVQAASSILSLAHSLVGLTVALQLGVADSLAKGLFLGGL